MTSLLLQYNSDFQLVIRYRRFVLHGTACKQLPDPVKQALAGCKLGGGKLKETLCIADAVQTTLNPTTPVVAVVQQN